MAELQIPAGWGDLALKATPFDLANPLAEAAKIQQQRADTANTQATMAETGARTATLSAELPGVRAESQTKQASAQNALIADATSKVDPNSPDPTGDWHAAMQALVDQGVTQAKQFLSAPYTASRARQVVGVYGAKDAGEGLGASQSGGLPSDVPTPAQQQQWDGIFHNLPPDQMQAKVASLDAIKAALVRVSNSDNPAAAWDKEAGALGLGAAAGAYSGLNWQRMWDQVAPLDRYLRGRLQGSGLGLPAPPVPVDFKEAGGGLYATTLYGPNGGPSASLVGGGQSNLVGTDPATGKAIYHNPVSNTETEGQYALGQKPGTYGAGSGGAFEIRRNAYLAVHPGDDAGALDYARTGANGAAGHQMGAAQLQIAASSQARADWNAMVNSGSPLPPEGEESWVQNRASTYYAPMLAQAQNDVAGGGTPGPAAPGGPDPAVHLRAQLRQDWQASIANLNSKDPAIAAAARRNMATIEGQAAQRLVPIPSPPPPPRAVAQLRAGQVSQFPNGQGWSLRDGKPVRLW